MPGYNQHPSIQWLTEMWNWLTNNQIPLEKFRGIPLIPVTNNTFLTKLQKHCIIYRTHQQWSHLGALTESVCLFLEDVGANVLRNDLPSSITRNPDLNNYILFPTPGGVLSILSACKQSVNIERCVANMTPTGKNELRCLFGRLSLSQVTQEQKQFLRLLPLFVSSDNSYIPARQGAVPRNFFGIPVNRLKKCRITITDSFDDNLVTLLGIRKESTIELLSNNILPAVAERFYAVDESMTIMSWVLANPEYDGLVKLLKFILTADDKLVSPLELFEPSDQLVLLFGSANVFPINAYAKGKLLNHLKRVGLKTDSSVTSIDLLNVATEVARSQEIGQADFERAKVLINHINRFPHLLSTNFLSNRITKALYKFLEDLNWVPCEGSPPTQYPISAGWYGNNNTLYSPRQVGLIESAMLQGSVVPLVSMPGIRQELLNAFNWSAQLDPGNYQKVENVVLHLKNVASNFVYPADIPDVFHALLMVYGFLSGASDQHLKHLFHSSLASQPWVWHGAGFTTPDKIALTVGTLRIDLKPYLFTVPESMKRHSHFFARMGIQQTFQESALNDVLLHIQVKHAVEHVCDETSIKSDFEQVHSILRYITSLVDFDSQTLDLLVPCRALGTSHSCLYMMEASKCLYVDEERLMKQLSDENLKEEFDKRIIHQSIANDLAQRLGVQPLSHVLAPSEAIDYGYELAGPHETTVNAIKRNLDMYKKGVDIFKELIQNADDAGATEVKFLIDWRRNEETANNLLSDGMKTCHGPSMWAYNNARFSKEDITNICSIAAQSKKHKLDKIGRFGLGFTSVYHLTDVPSVVSGPYVLICDPRTTHLGSRVHPGQPGIKLDLTQPGHHRTLTTYPNQFQPYNGIFGCNLSTSTDGFEHTLIRLPLRTCVEAAQHLNQLAEGVFDSKDAVKPLVDSLKKASSTLLLFTQNVVHVSIHELDSQNPCEMNEVMSVTLERIHQMPRPMSGQEGDLKTERNLLAATSTCKENSSLPIPKTTMIVMVTQETPAPRSSSKAKKKLFHFIISSCMVQGEILNLAETIDGCRAGVLPCGGVAAELVAGVRGLTPKPVDGSVFSYLPLEVSTGLPFHVNGNFLLQPNRRQLWSKPSSSSGEFEARWNICFIESVLSRALFNLLQDLQIFQSKNVVDARDFQSLWPKSSQCTSDFRSFTDMFYHTLMIDVDAPTVIFNGNQWVAVKDCFFTKWNQSDSEVLKTSVKTLLRKKLKPRSWVELDPDVLGNIARDSNTFTVSRFLEDVFFEMLREGDIESSHRDNIVLHLLDLRLGERKVTDYDDILKNIDCIPFSPDEDDLVSPNRLVNPNTLIGSLYSEGDNRFPHGEEYLKDVRLLSLKDLGMSCNDLPWEDVCERAESIGKNDGNDQKIKNLLRLIDEKLRRQDNPTAEQKRRLQNAEFLPVLSKPNDYPSVWFKRDSELMSAASLYESRHMFLIGSVQPLLDEVRLGSETMNQNVKGFLGLGEKEAKVSDVIIQLDILIDVTQKGTQQTSYMTHRMYSFFQDAFTRDNIGDQNLDRLCSLRFVLCEGEFRACHQLAFKYTGKSGPYLFRVPTDLLRFETLLKHCGVKQRFDINDYLLSMQRLKEEFRENPLSEVAVKTAESMTSEIVTIFEKGCEVSQESITISMELQDQEMFVLDNHCILRKPSELIYDDMRWVKKTAIGNYTHTSVTPHAAEIIGIKTTRQMNLENRSSSSGFESEFGQKEELADRLSSILRSYSHVSDVFKELLQNADDAGATEIHFVYDPRKHSSKKVISTNWAGVQNLPALCVYNDKSFTEADIKGIQKVGVGGKRDDIATTGRFGIGFNAVYHLTDCPSFLSNKDTLCVFDPLLKYTARADSSCPGRMYTTNEGFRQYFPDMLSGYLEGEFKASEGTLFRLPLRAMPSKISNECFTSQKVESLLHDFQIVSKEILLFLNNIKKITISRINEVTKQFEVKYSTNATFCDEDKYYRAKLSEHVKLFKSNPHETNSPMCHVYNIVVQDSYAGKEKWLVSQMVGFEEEVEGCRGSNIQLPRGGVAALISSERCLHHPGYRAYCVLPLPIYTRLPVHVNGMFELDSPRRNLSKCKEYKSKEKTGDGELIHGWNGQLITGVIAPAYAKLLVKAGRLILQEPVGNLQSMDPFMYYDNLFPKDLEIVHDEWRLVAKATLRYISEKNLEVLPVARQQADETQVTWHHVNTATSLAYFDNLRSKDTPQDFASDALKAKKKPPRSTILRSFLLKVGFNLLKSSLELCQAFKRCDVQAEFVSPEAVVKHLLCNPLIDPSSSVPLTRTAFQDLSTFSTLFEYCLQSIAKPIELNGLPLQLKNDNEVGVFTTLDGLYITPHCKVLPNLKQLFLHRTLVNSCFIWLNKNKAEDEAYTSGIFKKFTISEFAVHLGMYLPKDWQGCSYHIKWTPEKNGHPSTSWLRNMWEFICSETTEEIFQSCLQPIQEWPLFPTTSGTLVSPAMSKTLLLLDGFSDSSFRESITTVLIKLGVPELSMKHMPLPSPKFIGLLKNYLALPVNQERSVDVIKFMLDTDSEIGNISSSESETLLQYLQEGCDSFSNENIQTIKMLKIFKLLDGKMTNLQSYDHYHTFEGYILLAVEAETWMNYMNCVFLNPSRQLTLIYCKLGISPITHIDVYLKFVLPSFNILTLESKVSHLKNIEDRILRHAAADEQKAIIGRLSQLPFIPDGEGTLRTVEYFFDPDNEVFKAMVYPNQLLPESMRLVKYFLSRIGLHTQVTQELFVKFARTIESEANAVTSSTQLETLFSNAKRLTRELQFCDSLHIASFLREIAEIKFIPSVPIKRDLINIHPAVSDDQDLHPFISYRGSMPEMFVELVWSVAMLLPSWSLPSNLKIEGKVNMHDCLGIATKVVIDNALGHIQNVCGKMHEKNAFHKEDTVPPRVRSTLKTVMSKILTFVQGNITEHGKELKRRLHHTPLCLVDEGKVLIKADQLVFNMTGDEEKSLKPYLYKAPRELSDFDVLIRFLGGQEQCSFDQLAGVLSAIQSECKTQRLNPNEIINVITAVTALFRLLDSTKGACKITVSELCLPNSNQYLRNASHLYYADPHLMDQMKLVSTDKEFLIPLKHCGFDVNDEVSLIELLPESLRPKNLGNEMHENVHEDNKDCPAGQECQFLEHVKRMLNSVEMTRVLLRLVQHQQQDKPPNAETTHCIEQLQNFGNFSCKIELQLGLFDTSGKMIANRPSSASAFYDKTCIHVYLEHSWPPEGGVVFKQIADCCNKVIGQLMNGKHESYLQAALQCKNPNGMNAVLSQLQIPEYDTTTRGLQPDEYPLGTIVQRDVRHLLDHDPYNKFHEGEIVGYERSLEDTSYPVDESTALGTGEWLPLESEHLSDETTEIIYAKIIEQFGESDASARLSRQYRIDIGLKEPIIVKVTALYKFLRPQEKPDLTLVPFTGDPTAEVPSTLSDDSVPDVFKNYEEKIKEQLKEAFELPEDERKRAIKRLYRKWHPDKNFGQETLANEAFQFLKADIDRHEKGSNYRENYSQWEKDARRDREEAEQYQKRYYKDQTRDSERASSHFVPPSFSKETPNPRSARLWFRQAEEHLHNAEQTKNDLPTHLQWIAFQIHQAAEMALTAAQYSLDGHPDMSSNDLTSLARTVCQHRDVTSREVLTRVCDLICLGCDFSKPRQPDTPSSRTSEQTYHDFHVSIALQLGRELLDLIRDIIGIKVV